jgi:DNA helicase-2/ATP-dependent DNA helicase PcrA
MLYHADLHIHSKHSRATSRDCDLEHLALWARRKGIAVLGTGDFTHPAWREEIRDKLIPAEPGLFRLRPDLEAEVERQLPGSCHGPSRFLLSVEISTIYKKGERTRKIHHLVFAPDFDTAGRVVSRLERIGNLRSDGRPILGLDSRHLLEIVLESGPGAYLIPAHIWTPWFAVLGSKSGFDAVEDCYGDLSGHIFAMETGLSSDPAMNWRVSKLDRYRLVSNSDAHSPPKLGREACRFDTELDYYALRNALETGRGYIGTVEFFPDEGKYHLDGHRKCGIRLEPRETRERSGLCPSCQKPVTVGVLHRVEELADREGPAAPPATAGEARNLVPLPEILGEILGAGPETRGVGQAYGRLLDKIGPELFILEQAPLEEIGRSGPGPLAEAIRRLREGRVLRQAGYDGEYGVIRLFEAHELRGRIAGGLLFDPPAEVEPNRAPARPGLAAAETSRPAVQVRAGLAGDRGARSSPSDLGVLAGLDEEQRAAAAHGAGALLIVAGPGSGKTRTLTHRIAHLLSDRGVAPERCLAITFTRRAAQEMRERLQSLLPSVAERVAVHTFHSLGLQLLREHGGCVGVQRGFRVADEAECVRRLAEALGKSEREATRRLKAISHAKRTRQPLQGPELISSLDAYRHALALENLVDFDDLVGLAAEALEAEPAFGELVRGRWTWVFLDEYQDIDEAQYRLVRQIAPRGSNLCAIGDPDQAIYGFRGADVLYFRRFVEDHPGASCVRLGRNYRSTPLLVAASRQVIASEGSPDESCPSAEGARVTLHSAATAAAEAEFVVHSIEQMLGGHSFFSVDSGRAETSEVADLSFADFAVLYRTDAQSDALVEAFARSGMPFQMRSHAPLLEQPGVRDLCRALVPGHAAGTLVQQLREAAEAALVAGDSGAIQEAVEILAPLAAAAGSDLDRFVSELALATSADTLDPRADRVSLLTLHAAKGLEFAAVFILGCEEGLLPLRFGDASAEDVDEERRLFYVGMTRAKERLFLCRAKKRLWRGKLREMQPSRFLQPIQERLIERSLTRTAARRRKEASEQLTLF